MAEPDPEPSAVVHEKTRGIAPAGFLSRILPEGKRLHYSRPTFAEGRVSRLILTGSIFAEGGVCD
ncbi:hypothetical protein FJ942_06820 [Mesorhizobium sp. B2-4-2]|uniref:hypothetical protein n=1 Tax=unclassified Mesorhizobium TaxID=325217 RepID=UPI00112EAF40|nr:MULTISPECIES: hypothetical protein [unclassified Mesorhizobium]MBZ9958754.1 hypothetical protein [Mesorhizobium sp. BR1-1-14]TPL60272.1 hypothetical protein FJ942_06820 [Mesorhizobium sp. B2-4-2]